jgi:hypothetical protein
MSTDRVHRQIEDLQKYVQSQHEMFLMQQKQSLQLRQNLQSQIDRCLRKAHTVLRDNRNRQYVQKLIIARQYAQLQTLQASSQVEQEQLATLRALLDSILSNQTSLSDQVTALNTQLQASLIAVPTPVVSPPTLRSSASLLAAALGGDDTSDDAVSAAAASAKSEAAYRVLLTTLQDMRASQDAMLASLTEKMPNQVRAGFDALLPRLVAAMEESATSTTSADEIKHPAA